jgi:hypothetical protein
MKTYGGVDVQIHVFLTLAPVEVNGQSFKPQLLYPGERAPGTHWIGDWVGPRTCLDVKKKFLFLPGLELRPLCRPARSQSL